MRFHCAILLLLTSRAWAAANDPVSFRNDVAPILVKQCVGCHGAEKAKGGYRLDTFENLLRAGDSGAAPVAPGDAGKGELYRLLTTADPAERMPKKADRLPDAQLAVVRKWIESGATFDGPDRSATLASLTAAQEQPAPPAVYRQPMPITALAFSPDGTTLAAGGYHEVTLWDATTGKLTGRIPRTVERIFALDFSPDGKTLAVAGGEPGTLGEVRLCDVTARRLGESLDRIGDAMLAVKFSPDGKLLAAGGADNVIRIFDATTRRRLRTIEQHADWVTDLAFSPDGARLASASRDKSARVFDVKSGAMIGAFLGHEEPLFSVAWVDENVLASAARDRRVRAWVATDEKDKGEIRLRTDPLRVLVAGKLLFVCGADGIVREYGADKRDLLRELGKGGDWALQHGDRRPPPPRRHGGQTGRVVVWDFDKGTPITTFVAAPGIGGG